MTEKMWVPSTFFLFNDETRWRWLQFFVINHLAKLFQRDVNVILLYESVPTFTSKVISLPTSLTKIPSEPVIVPTCYKHVS